jgi:hypothetical protein
MLIQRWHSATCERLEHLHRKNLCNLCNLWGKIP